MNLKTNYLGLDLRTPLVPSASPLSERLDNIKRMEDAGAAAVVMHSLFGEHLSFERHQFLHHLSEETDSYSEALTYSPQMHPLPSAPEIHLNQIIPPNT